MIEIISILTGIISAIGVSIMLYNLRHLKKDYVDVVNDPQLKLSMKRILLEDDVYDANEKFVSSIGFDADKQIYNENINDITLSQNVVDDSYFRSLGFTIREMKIKPKAVTCLMPFHPRYGKIFLAIKEACQDNDFDCTRSDDKYVPGKILEYTVDKILCSQIVIGVLEGRNPNVYYELGIAHSIGKTVILITEEKNKSDIPFDLRTHRFIFYKSMTDLKNKLDNALKVIGHDGN